MKLKHTSFVMLLLLAASGVSCNDDERATPAKPVKFKAHSVTPNFLTLKPGFNNVKIYPILSSEDQLGSFIYGSMADGAGLIKNSDGTFTLINNIEADYSIARITLDNTFKPVAGEYILNAVATASTAQCSGSLITMEEHGFGPLYLSGGEWGGASKGVFSVDPFKSASSASTATMLPALGQWSTENAVAIGKDAYTDKTVVIIGDDESNNTVPSGHLGIYVGNRGDLSGGKLYTIKVTDPGVDYEMDMAEGQEYNVEMIELTETGVDELDAEAKSKGAMAFSRTEDIDWRRGSAANQREIYIAVTGRNKADLVGKGTLYGRVYKLVLNPTDPTGPAKITPVLDGDKVDGKAYEFLSPDNILVTENYAYIQEDPNQHPDAVGITAKEHYAQVYQYNLVTGELKTVLECDQVAAEAQGYGVASDTWEITGMIDISEQVGIDNTFLLITQNHGWTKDGVLFTDPDAIADAAGHWAQEGSVLHVIAGLEN